MAYTTVLLPTANGGTIPVAAEQTAGVTTFHSVPEVSGAAVTTINPLPIMPMVAGGAVSSGNPLPVINQTDGTAADTPWSGAGPGSLVAIMKALWLSLTGGLSLLDSGGVNKAAINALGALSVTARNGVTIAQTVVALAANSDVPLIAANANRKFLKLINIGLANASLNFNAAATVGTGYPLGAAPAPGQQGQVLEFSGAGVSLDAVHGIAAAATTIVVLEGT